MCDIEIDQFKTVWTELITKIENTSIDGEGINDIELLFNVNKHDINYETEEDLNKGTFEVALIESRLIVALSIAHSRFRLASRGALAKFFGELTDKLPIKEAIGRK
jgi:hypothetical protein